MTKEEATKELAEKLDQREETLKPILGAFFDKMVADLVIYGHVSDTTKSQLEVFVQEQIKDVCELEIAEGKCQI